MPSSAVGTAVDDAEYNEIQRYLNREAAMLDRREFTEWLALLADDVTYRVTLRRARDDEAGPERYAIVDDDRANLELRVNQIADPRLTRAENPPSLTRRFVSNMEATRAAPEKPKRWGLATMCAGVSSHNRGP